MNPVSPENLILIGKVIRPHGLLGLLRIWSYAQSENSFLNADSVFLKSDTSEMRGYKVLSLRPHKNIYLMKLDGLNSLEEAEDYRGAEILISKDRLLRDQEDEYFWFELIGLKVYLNSGRYLGILKQILNTGSNDIYVIREGKAEFLIPATHDVVEDIDLENNRMIVNETEGLFDLDEV